MPDEAPEQPLKETWRDWQARYAPHVPEPPIDELWTRPQLMAELHRIGFTVTDRTIRTWEKLGIIPSPERHNIGGVSRVLYPPWAGYLIAFSASEHRRGRPVEEIEAAVRSKAFAAISFADTHTQAWADLAKEISAVLLKWANRYRERHNVAPAQMIVRALDHDGNLIGSYDMPIHEGGDLPSGESGDHDPG